MLDQKFSWKLKRMKSIVWAVLFTLFLEVLGRAEAQFSEETHMANVGHHCFCDKGFRQVAPCNKTAAARCEPCPTGQYQDRPNDEETCKRCSVCPRTSRPSRPCSPTQDAECTCVDSNHHFSKLLGYCSECTPCLRGYEAVTECSFSHDRKCQRCPKGTFSDTKNGRCRPCSLCQKYIVTCNGTHDSVCHVTRGEEKGSNFTLPLVAAVCLALVGTLVFVFIKRKRCRRRRNRCFGSRERRQRELAEVEEVELELQQSDPVPGPSERSQLMEIELHPPVPMKVLKYQTIEDIAVKLNGKCENNWRKLAKELDIDDDMVGCLEQVPLEATQKLLQEFSTRKDASIQGLYHMLLSINRQDAAEKLLPYLNL